MSSLEKRPPRAAVLLAVIGFLCIIFVQMALMARDNSATWDEADHTYAGYMQWRHGDFGLNAEHPPLVKFLATLPLLDMHLKEPPLRDQAYRLQEVRGGKDFVFHNDANAILLRARLAASSLTLLLAVLVFLAAREMFGVGAGLLALALISFDPTLLGHSALVTTDAGQACFMFWAIYAFYRYTRQPGLWRIATVGLVTGLALAAKHSAVLLFPMFLLLAGCEVWRNRRSTSIADRNDSSLRYTGQWALALVGVGVIAVVVLWSFYGFRYAARGNGLPLNPNMQEQLHRVPSHLEARLLASVDRLHLLPQSYTYGFAHVLIQSRAFTSFLLGTIHPHPVWYYFPVAIVIKSTLTFLLLLAVSVWAITSGRVQISREMLYLLIPASVYMAFAMAGGMNIGIRHILPIYVFLSVAIAGVCCRLVQRNKGWLYAVCALLLFQAVSVLHAFPAYVSYANEAFGGPANVHKYLSDSSADWAQQMKAVSRYLKANQVRQCWFAYFGQGVIDYSYYDIPCRPLITADSLYFDGPHDVPPAIDGPVLMSAGILSGFEFGPDGLNPYEQFKTLKPAAVIDYGVFVFDGHFQIPLAAALSHVQKASILLQDHHPAAALAEARDAEALASQSALVNATMGKMLDANGEPAQAAVFYNQALTLARTTEPQFQTALIQELERRVGNTHTLVH